MPFKAASIFSKSLYAKEIEMLSVQNKNQFLTLLEEG